MKWNACRYYIPPFLRNEILSWINRNRLKYGSKRKQAQIHITKNCMHKQLELQIDSLSKLTKVSNFVLNTNTQTSLFHIVLQSSRLSKCSTRSRSAWSSYVASWSYTRLSYKESVGVDLEIASGSRMGWPFAHI